MVLEEVWPRGFGCFNRCFFLSSSPRTAYLLKILRVADVTFELDVKFVDRILFGIDPLKLQKLTKA